jgi:hypothetical protein
LPALILEPPMRARRLFLGLCLALLGSAAVSDVRAGMLVEALFNGEHVRVETGSDRNLVLVTMGASRHLVDVERQYVYPLNGVAAEPIRAALLDDGARMLPYNLTKWSPGPQVAGHASTYHVLEVGEQICGEVLASAWMTPFIEPIIRSLELMQRIEPALRPVDRDSCGAITFTVYARNGWPLMAGWVDEAAFLTQTVRFDHYPDDALFRRP